MFLGFQFTNILPTGNFNSNIRLVKIILLVAKAKNRVIGKDNQLVWKLSADLKRFKHLTTGHYLLMGRKTFESLGRPLPNRTHLIITRNTAFEAPDGHFVFHSVEEALIFCTKRQLEKLFVIGGGEIYKEALPLCDALEITEVDASPEGDTFFPELDPNQWIEKDREEFPADESNEYPYAFVSYEKR
jgi:dihydrofolate reductase